MKKIYDFDKIVSRLGTDAIKYEFRNQVFKNENVIPMWVADMDFETPDFILEAIKARTEHPVLGYTSRGERFYNAVSNWLNKRHNWQVQNDWIAYSPGVVPGLAMAVLAFTQAGDKIIIQTPVYHPFHSTVKDLGRQLVENELIENEGYYQMDFDKLEALIDSRTKMLILSNPHNPVGRVWTKEELFRLGEICVKHNVLIVSDDIHSDLVFKPHSYQPIAQLSDEIAMQTVSFFAPSKTFNLAGLSTSVMVSANPELLKKYNNTLENLHLYTGNIFGNIALIEAYEKGEEWLEQLLAYLQRNIDVTADFLRQNLPKIKMLKPEGTYLAWLDFRAYDLTQKELNDLIIHKANLGLNSGDMFGKTGAGFQRINLACSRQILVQALENLTLAF